ncbi:MAG TPA: hypothetical protein VI789_07545 [Dehalococcoidia bacterium]|nr:hypothetical protein [Dehalococcoidia bacterium]
MPLHSVSSALLLAVVFLACRSPAATPTPITANACASGVEVGRAVVSGAQMGQGTTVAFAYPEDRAPAAIAVRARPLAEDTPDAEPLVLCGLIPAPLPTSPTDSLVEIGMTPVGDAILSGTAEISPGEGRYEGRLQIKVTTRGADPFVPYWLVLIAQ